MPGGSGVQTDQLLYNLTRRGIEHDLLPWLRERGVPAHPLDAAALAELDQLFPAPGGPVPLEML